MSVPRNRASRRTCSAARCKRQPHRILPYSLTAAELMAERARVHRLGWQLWEINRRLALREIA